MSLLRIATTQMPCSWNLPDNLDRAEQLVRQAAAQGAQVILLQELFATPYFCIEQDHRHQALAEPYADSPILQRFAALAGELGVVLPLSWYERAGNAFFNSLTVADADGRLLGIYRKTHIPNAIGSEPGAAELDSRDHWQVAMRGHAAANLLPVVAANRVGEEVAGSDQTLSMRFYGSSFICDHKGALLAEADRSSTGIWLHDLDLARMREDRLSWGIYRDRRPEMYAPLLTLDGHHSHLARA